MNNLFKLCKNSVFLIVLFSWRCLAFTVVIDPGHGGIDSGASRGSFIESQIVFKIAEKIEALLKKTSRINVSLTRLANRGVSLKDRVKIAQEKKADLFLSLHANSSPSNQVTGMEYYFSAKTAAPLFLKQQTHPNASIEPGQIVETIQKDLAEFGKLKRSLELSKKIQTVWAQNESANKQRSVSKIRRAPFYVIENTSMPSVLVEVGFISNQREARKLVSSVYQDELARALTEAIVNFKEMSDK